MQRCWSDDWRLRIRDTELFERRSSAGRALPMRLAVRLLLWECFRSSFRKAIR